MNQLYFGDNLEILREYIPDESVDLIYLDPPFNSKASYNVLFKEKTGLAPAAQVHAFEDTWEWNQESKATYDELTLHGPKRLSDLMQALHQFLGTNDMLAYLVMMAPRLVELRRVMKPTASIYLHCDPAASHYLKILMDAVFKPENFRNEIVWRRSHPKGHAFTRFASTHDVILAFAKNGKVIHWSPIYLPYDAEKAEQQYSLKDENGRRYQLTSLLNPNPDRPNLTYEFKGVTKVWRWTKERMIEADAKGLIVVPKGGRGIPRFKRYLDEQEGIPLGDWWGNIEIVSGGERLGYQTQKPLALLERIISSSSNPGDIVLDPFCGCGTTVVAAEKLNRQWIGIDITHLAIRLMEDRLQRTFGSDLSPYKVIGAPEDLASAEALALKDKYRFESWALSLIDAQPATGKKGSDRGIDGFIYFQDPDGKIRQILVSVKGGHVTVSQVRDLIGTMQREKADIGAFITLEEPSHPMVQEAVNSGYYELQLQSGPVQYPRVQILTIKELFEGKRLLYPQLLKAETFRRATRIKEKSKSRELLHDI